MSSKDSIGGNSDMPHRGCVQGTLSHAFQAMLYYSSRDLNGISANTPLVRGYPDTLKVLRSVVVCQLARSIKIILLEAVYMRSG